MSRHLRLKTRLKLKYLQKHIDSMVEWNFGYCPNTAKFDDLIDQRTCWENLAKQSFPDLYEDHFDRVYNIT